METLTQNTEQVFLTGPKKNFDNENFPVYYKVTIGKTINDPAPRKCYRVYDRDKAIRLAERIAYDQYLSLASTVIPEEDLQPYIAPDEVVELVSQQDLEIKASKAKSKPRPRKA